MMIEERLILVDENNRAAGTATKRFVHRRGLLHRAFSIFLIDDSGRILLQQRHPDKYHSGGLWANSCCGHPRFRERTVQAARRRLKEELGIDAALRFTFFSRYEADLDHGMRENEFVYVYFGRLLSPAKPDMNEIIGIELATPEEILSRMNTNASHFAYWFEHYFRAHYPEIVEFTTRLSKLQISACADTSDRTATGLLCDRRLPSAMRRSALTSCTTT